MADCLHQHHHEPVKHHAVVMATRAHISLHVHRREHEEIALQRTAAIGLGMPWVYPYITQFFASWNTPHQKDRQTGERCNPAEAKWAICRSSGVYVVEVDADRSLIGRDAQ